MPLAFLAPDDLATSGLPEVGITLTNPLAAEESVLRTSLRPGLLKSVAYNVSHRNDSVALFEIGKVFLPPPAGQQLPDEREVLSAVLAGRDARDAVEVWLVLVDALGVRDASLRQTALAGLHPTRSAEVVVGGDGARRGRRDRPRGARPARHPGPGRLARGRPRPAARPAHAAPRPTRR